MRLVMHVQRVGDQYQGSLTRTDNEQTVGFDGAVELLAALDRLDRGSESGVGEAGRGQGQS
ncbi:MAG: hypothetical protein JO147_05800 [Actinobacteria bacterium]|nr:hypothetical protein [Actinomycetota bacterium]